MREYMDRAFEDFCNSVLPFAACMLEIFKIVIIYSTLPLWIVPYMVYRKIEERKQNHA